MRAKAIAVLFAIAQAFGSFGPFLSGELIGSGHDHFRLFLGSVIGASVMIIGAVVESWLGVTAERRSREEIATPIFAGSPPPRLSRVTGAPRPPAARSTLDS